MSPSSKQALRRKTPTRQELLDLKNGVDRGGKARTWVEVAQITGFSNAYVGRLGRGVRYRPRPLPVLLIDPREYDTDLSDLTDEQVAAWQAKPYCLCGCGGATLQELRNDASAKVPQGAHRLFLRNHWRRLPRYRDIWVANNADPARIAQIIATQAKKKFPAADLNEMVWHWKCSEPGRSLAQLGRLAHVSPQHVQALGRREYVRTLTAAKLHAAMGVPMTRELYREYKMWAGRRSDLPVPILQD